MHWQWSTRHEYAQESGLARGDPDDGQWVCDQRINKDFKGNGT
jgi:hypothetical protein